MRGLGFILALLLSWAVNVPGAMAEPVQVRASEGDGYARLTFRWAQPVGHQATRQGDRLVINFARPIEANLAPVVRRLATVIAAVEPAPNGSTVVLRIKGEFTVRSYDSGTSVVVDIVADGQQQASKPVEPAPRSPATADAGPKIALRVGAHETFSRIVFDWPTTTAYKVVRTGATAVIEFSKPGRVQVGALARGRTANVLGAETFLEQGNLRVALKVAPTSQIKAFTSGPKVVVDVYAPGTQAAAPVSAPQEKGPSKTVPETSPEPSPKPAQAESEKPTSPAPLALIPQSPTSQASLADQPIEARAKASALDGGGVSLRFDWDEPVGAAVFRRAGDLWVIFDKRAKIDTEALLRDGAGLITFVQQVPSRGGAVLRLRTPESVNPSIKRAGLAWVLDFFAQPLVPNVPLQADAQPDSPLGARLFVSVPEPGNAIAFQDPEVGDNLIAVPVIPLAYGMSRVWSYPQLKFLPSRQGVVIKPLSDDIRVRPLRQGVEVTSTGALQISSVSAEQRANVELQQQLASSAGMGGGALTRVLNLEKWKRPDLASFTEIKRDLQRKIAFSKNDREQEKNRRELLQFFFANGFQAEALAVLAQMVGTNPDFARDPEYLLMHGAASWLMGRMKDARRDLYNPALDAFDEATFWRAAVVAGEGNLAGAAYELRQTGAITQPYPKAIKMPTATLVAEAAVELGDVKQATQYLEVLGVDNPSPAQKDQIGYVAGKLKELSGDFDGAISEWETVMAGRHRGSRAKAAVARTELLYKRDLFSAGDVIEEYEKLRFVWRGDDFEFSLLRRLGALYLDQKLYRDGLRTLRQAATYFPDNEQSNQVTKQMSDTFNFLYLEDGADVLPAVTAIALYDEFRELTPPGARGDQMIRRLADRLVGVDLLSRAADILESQIDFRLSGETKSRVGARLALIYLLDRRYDKTIAALNKTQRAPASETLAEDRLLLRAQAQIGLGNPQVALDLLTPFQDKKAQLVRSGIYWRQGDWKNAAKSLARLLREMGARPRKKLDESQAGVVLSLAIAQTLAGNEGGVARLVGSYGARMRQSIYADAFQLIAQAPESGLVNVRGLDPIVKKAVDFQGFMDLYRQRIADGKLSSLY